MVVMFVPCAEDSDWVIRLFDYLGLLEMARYEHLPIYAKAMELAVYLQSVVRNFSRYDKYTIGTELRNHTRAII
jgi:hypothetical protein